MLEVQLVHPSLKQIESNFGQLSFACLIAYWGCTHTSICQERAKSRILMRNRALNTTTHQAAAI